MDEQKTVLSAQHSTGSVQIMGTTRFTIIGHRPFNRKEGTWGTWILQVHSFIEINFINESNLMRSCLSASLTPNTFEKLRRSCLPPTRYDFTYDEYVAMKELYRRQKILMREKANFFRITQSDHQSRKQFANRLREAAGHCNFESFNTEAALVLQFISGMKDEEINVRLLAKENIKLDEALRFLEMYEEIHAQRRFEWRSFTVHEVNLNGETMVTVEGDTGMRKPVLRVAKIRATNIMGLDCINAFRASETLCSLLTNKKEVNALVSRTQSDVCAEFPEVFEDGLGHCTKVEAHVVQKDGFVPVFRKPFPLAFAIHDAVGKELERYVDMGVLTPTDSSVWAATIVTVKN
ncbi:Uncharacterized protein T4D_5874 [Trichinella pseudospiralis]|uniref:Uncharacterized protein n=1 Tax=Trichinella pseudospiralis TaxID=6337 RepID=A0A0V1F4U8_TRIPS|nr:Uncharacterized protein T4D_5874 [Trichinella pseudospiralis]